MLNAVADVSFLTTRTCAIVKLKLANTKGACSTWAVGAVTRITRGKMRTPPRRASRNSGSGFGKRIKVAKKPFSPEPAEKKRKENKSASAGSRDGDGDGKKSRRGRATGQGRRRNGKAKDDEPVNKVRRTPREHVD